MEGRKDGRWEERMGAKRWSVAGKGRNASGARKGGRMEGTEIWVEEDDSI